MWIYDLQTGDTRRISSMEGGLNLHLYSKLNAMILYTSGTTALPKGMIRSCWSLLFWFFMVTTFSLKRAVTYKIWVISPKICSDTFQRANSLIVHSPIIFRDLFDYGRDLKNLRLPSLVRYDLPDLGNQIPTLMIRIYVELKWSTSWEFIFVVETIGSRYYLYSVRLHNKTLYPAISREGMML